MGTRVRKNNGNLTETDNDGHLKRKQKSESSPSLQTINGDSSYAVCSDGNGKAEKKTRQPYKKKDSFSSSINGTDDSISTTKESPKRRSRKNKTEETVSGQDETNPSMSTKTKETTPKYRRNSKSVEQNDLGISVDQNCSDGNGSPENKTKERVRGQDATKPSISTKTKETTPKYRRNSKSVEQNDLGISVDQNCSDGNGSPENKTKERVSGQDATKPSMSTKTKETIPKYRRNSKSVEQNDLGISVDQNCSDGNGSPENKTKERVRGQDATKPSMSTKTKETIPKYRRSSKSVEQNGLGISEDQSNCSDGKESPTEANNPSSKKVYCKPNNGARRRNSKVNEDEDTANSDGYREMRRQTSRANSLSNPSLSILKDALKSLKLKMDEISKAAEKVNKVIDTIIKSELTKSSPLFKSLKKMSTGSYYENVKISNPNEFDIMLNITFESYQTIELTRVGESGAFYTVAFKKRKPASMARYTDDEGNILAKYILGDFRTLVDDVLQKSGQPATLEKKDPASPAVTLTITNEPENISVDLVLALEIRQWPEEAYDGMNIGSWLGTKEKQQYRKEPCYMVAKQANPRKKDTKDTWRISFSNIEKKILSHHGSAKTCCETKGVKCCRKPCLKLMKYILQELKKTGNQRRMNQFCSYHAKTALLHACIKYPKDEQWALDDLDVCFNRYVAYFQECLATGHLLNFFIPSHNLFSSEFIDRASCDYLWEELETQKNKNYPIFSADKGKC